MKHFEPPWSGDYAEITEAPVTERGDWVATTLGGMWSINNPHPRDVFLEDIAWGMSRTCRYGGQLRKDIEIFSVAEHSTLMLWWSVEEGKVRTLEDALKVILHDASEAFFGDIPTPIKKLLPTYKEMENRAQTVIQDAFHLTNENALISKPEIKEIDERIRIDERRRIIAEPAMSAGLDVVWSKNPDLKPLGVQVDCLLPSQARDSFLNCFAWCVENLPARDPVVAHAAKRQLDQIDDVPPGIKPNVMRVIDDPFDDEPLDDDDDLRHAI